ncbi:MAG: cysteine protease StiP family protein [Eubacterium sp.]|nr:cysteine protease StiP family protein [Eubacterium sp.]
MKSSFKKDDVILLLKDITGLVEPLPTKERELLIQGGKHYCEMLPLEYRPSQDYVRIYNRALEVFSKDTALAVSRLGQMLYQKHGDKLVIVSLARAGIPIGILLKRYIRNKYNVEVAHYSISIIRGRGIDNNAMKYILARHDAADIQFVDGWVGKGAIYKELKKELNNYPGVSDELAVLSDPAGVTSLCGTYKDFLIPSSCLNSTVSGLISRTFLRDDIIGENDFHGAAYYGELNAEDRTYEFIDRIESQFQYDIDTELDDTHVRNGYEEVLEIKEHFKIRDINFIKPGIGETTRVLLRRVPWKVLLDKNHLDDPQLEHIVQLAKEKNVPVESYSLKNYKCCGIISDMGDI